MKSNKLVSHLLLLAILYCFYDGFVNDNKAMQEGLALAYWIVSILGIVFISVLIAMIPKVDELKTPMRSDPLEIWPYRLLTIAYAAIFAYWGDTWLAVALTMCVLMGAQMRSLYNKRYDELNPTTKDEPTI